MYHAWRCDRMSTLLPPSREVDPRSGDSGCAMLGDVIG